MARPYNSSLTRPLPALFGRPAHGHGAAAPKLIHMAETAATRLNSARSWSLERAEGKRMTGRATEDFLVHLQQRLALSEGAAASMLATWLESYEPGPRARALRASRASLAPLAKRPSVPPSEDRVDRKSCA